MLYNLNVWLSAKQTTWVNNSGNELLLRSLGIHVRWTDLNENVGHEIDDDDKVTPRTKGIHGPQTDLNESVRHGIDKMMIGYWILTENLLLMVVVKMTRTYLRM